MINIFAMSIAGSIVVCLVFVCLPLTAKLFSAKWQYGIGQMAAAFFLIPVAFIYDKLLSRFPDMQAAIASITGPLPIRNSSDAEPSAIVHITTEIRELASTAAIETWLLVIWFGGVVLLTAWHAYCYWRFQLDMRRNSRPVSETSELYEWLERYRKKFEIRRKIQLRQHHRATSPCVTGLLRPVILLPSSDSMKSLDLEIVLAHELMHVKQKDLWMKLLVLIVGILHWCNPFAHTLRKYMETWSELCCDETLALTMTLAERRRYGQTLLNSLETPSNFGAGLSSYFSGGAQWIKRRLTVLVQARKMKRHSAISAVLVLAVIGSTGMTVSALAAPAASNYLEQGGYSSHILFQNKEILYYLLWTQDHKLQQDVADLQKKLGLSSEQMANLEEIALKEHLAGRKLQEQAHLSTANHFNSQAERIVLDRNREIKELLGRAFERFERWIEGWWEEERVYRSQLRRMSQ